MISRGDIVLVALEPAQGAEADKRRPAVVVSHDGLNKACHELGRGVVTVVPLTSNTTRVLSFQVFVSASRSGLSRDSKLQAEQVCAVSSTRVGPLLGRLPQDLIDRLDDALRLHLAL